MTTRIRLMTIFHLALLFTLLAIPPTYAQEDMTESHKATIRQIYEEGFTAGNLAILDTAYAEDYVNHGFGEDLNRDDFKAYLTALRSAMPDFQVTIEVLIAEDDWAASRVVYTGTFENEWVVNDTVIPPTGETLEWTANILHRFNAEGVVAEDFTAFDRLALPLPPDVLAVPDYLIMPPAERIVIEPQETQSEGLDEAFKAAFTNVIENALSKGELDIIDTTLSDDYRTQEPFGQFSREQFHNVMAEFRTAVPDLNVAIDAMLVEGDWLAARLIYTGTFTTPIEAGPITVEPTNEPIRLIINVFVHINAEGVPIEDFKEYNRIVWLQQFGVLPTPE